METSIKNYLLKVQNESKSNATNDAAGTSEDLPLNMVFYPNDIKYTVKDIAEILLDTFDSCEDEDKLIDKPKIKDIAKKLTVKDCQRYVNLSCDDEDKDAAIDFEYSLLAKFKLIKSGLY